MDNTEEHRINLRLPAELYQAVDVLRSEGGIKRSVNSWVAEAIQEKIQKETQPRNQPTHQSGRPFFEFFAGGGMARAGLGDGWHCAFANDFDAMKAQVYRKNWNGGHEFVLDDVNNITTAQLPGHPELVWASFPCQDLSLAGNYKGIGDKESDKQTRSGTFWPFWRLMRTLIQEDRAPSLIVLENVYGALTSHQGKDFAAICTSFTDAGYRIGALVVDAKHFVPQSRQRVFFIGVHPSVDIPASLLCDHANGPWHPAALQKAYSQLSAATQANWLWWQLPLPQQKVTPFAKVIEENPDSVVWHSPEETARILSLMAPLHMKKVEEAKQAKTKMVGGVYRRTRIENGIRQQRAEVRFDDIAGCLRTPSGGSSRQIILVVEGSHVRSRLLSTREAARLMGLPDSYCLPEKYNDAYHVAGDGVVVPVVGHLTKHIFNPVLDTIQVAHMKETGNEVTA
ncbi:DNA (cytosine-5-)-methyltransferase [Aquitalea sp. FJL05]|uniref:DNA cytosine methyltransferase n=1 Tax=Aquitalea sp. FJL05 TaxID=2153366 RepID=UPI000F5AC428|nr:DNA cytosine methyltransferase [Aquitalea sp. FJL05]RQO68254.1 DNA (cytosine-5-)-methyltransferase [Aquitalea sp. FJL05]